jgi:hypothetical protein
MSERWAASAPIQAAPALARLELMEDAAVCVVGERVWLRGSAWSESLDRMLRSIMGCERFMVTAGDAIVPIGKRLSCGELPAEAWIPLSKWTKLTIPPRMFVASPPTSARLSLVRSDQEREANLLRTTLAAWMAYAASAPQVRLKRWTFAVSADRFGLIQGLPLPPLPGLRYAITDGVAVPAGWTWRPALDAAVLRQWLGLERGELALLAPDGTCEKLSADAFVAATRSAVRFTAEALP